MERALATMAFMGIVAVSPLEAQEFSAGYELVVKQHPTEADPVGVVELWVWVDRECNDGQVVIATGGTDLVLSHPVLCDDPFGWCILFDCKLPLSSSCQIGLLANPPTVHGTRLSVFNFGQTLGGDVRGQPLQYDNPMHLMDLTLLFDDLTPRDVTISPYTATQIVSTTCVQDGMAPWPTPASTYVGSQAVFHVSGGGPCRADFDEDGELTIFDFLTFQNAFDAGDARADFDHDGELTLFDFLAFQNEFGEGCV